MGELYFSASFLVSGLFDFDLERSLFRWMVLMASSSFNGGIISILCILDFTSVFPFFISSDMYSCYISCNCLYILCSCFTSLSMSYFFKLCFFSCCSLICCINSFLYSVFFLSLLSNSSSVISSKLLVGFMCKASCLVYVFIDEFY